MENRSILDLPILIVDDFQENIDLLEAILEQADYTNYESTTEPLEAVRMAEEKEFDLVLTDIMMPKMDGFGVMDKLKTIELNHDTPVLVLTSLTDEGVRLRALNAGARDFLNKPFNPVEAVARVRNLLEVRLAQKELQNQNSILEEKVRERTKVLHDTRLEIIRRLGVAAEYKDNETGLHVTRMSLYSEALAKVAGMNASEAEFLMNVAPMHDIGKIGIRDSILCKPGKLTADEFEIMKKHTTIGAQIIGDHPSELLKAARVVALAHHEKWDGTGYPKGISGEAIPFIGGIVAVADVFDALTSKRPYKEEWPVDKATAYIEENSGLHFDPKIVDAFREAMPEILKIKSRYSEPG